MISIVRALALVLLALGVVACRPPSAADAVQAARDLGYREAPIVDLGDAAAVASQQGGFVVVDIVSLDGDEWVVSPITSHPDAGSGNSVHLISYANTGDRWNTFVYGSAQAGVSRVRLARFPEQAGGLVGRDRAWVIAIPDEDVEPSDLVTRFLSGDGQVVFEGDGIFPPDT